jgi:hypothetical protein
MDTRKSNPTVGKKNNDQDKKADGSRNVTHKSANNSEKTGSRKDAKK